ncbi:MAG TPA: diacylglycerol kinase family protein [Bryobacteraceae bacterium]|nr:diacylglycerol kinase family protein [Bryobacteraceae bacterium]
MTPFSAQRAAILYNPIARGLSRHIDALHRVPALLSRNGIQTDLVPTRAAGTAGEQAREQIASGCELIIAAGGDGTINEVIEGMIGSRVPLAILPGGTANVLAREVKLPIGIARAAAQITHLEPCRISVGALKLNEGGNRHFICMTGAGLDAQIVSRLNLQLKASIGKFAYYVAGFSQVFGRLTEFDVLVDGRTYRASFALVSRVRNYGGDLEIARGASLLRDDFEIVLFRGTASLRYLSYLASVVGRQLHRTSGCTVLYGRTISLHPPQNQDVLVQVDGELAGKLPAAIDILPGAITLLVPPAFLAREAARLKIPAYA